MSSNIKSEPTLNFLVKVDRSQKPIYPDFMKKVIHPEFELTRPNKFDLQNDVSILRHDTDRYSNGRRIYDSLKENDLLLLKNCLNLADLLAIQGKRIKVFRSLYEDITVFGWKSVIEGNYGKLFVPCLFELDDKIALEWRWIDYYWYRRSHALRFSK